MSPKASQVLDFLCSMPTGHITTTKEVAGEIMLAVDGQLISCGTLYDIKVKHVGAGVYDLSLRRFAASVRNA